MSLAASVDASAQRAHRALLDAYYGWARPLYDVTRKHYLLGRDRALEQMLDEPWTSLVEVGAGTGRNLAILHARRAGPRYGALEPSRPMREHLARRCPWAEIRDGFAEELGVGVSGAYLLGVAERGEREGALVEAWARGELFSRLLLDTQFFHFVRNAGAGSDTLTQLTLLVGARIVDHLRVFLAVDGRFAGDEARVAVPQWERWQGRLVPRPGSSIRVERTFRAAVLARVDYAGMPRGASQSYCRMPDGTGDFTTCVSSPGAAN
ncbi:MAG: hypothetical protein OHK0013_10070 [Sandaracinaceae bacterium]